MSELTRPEVDIEDVAIEFAKELQGELYDMDANTKEYLDVEHGTYTRELFLPAGTLAIGKKHKQSCVNILSKGRLIVKSEIEDEGVEINVSHEHATIFTSEAGTRKIAYILEDTIFINVFYNVKAQRLEDVEAELVIPSEKYDKFMKEKELAWHGV